MKGKDDVMGGATAVSGGTTNVSNYAPTFYRSFSGTDALVFIMLPQTEPILLGSLSTISYSMYRDKKPVPVIGRINVGGFTRGTRIYAGTLIFTLLNQHWVNEVKEKVTWLKSLNRLKTDELPLFDLMIVCANEYGAAMQMFIYGVDLTEEGQVLSVEDLFIENTFNFVARDISNFSYTFKTENGSRVIQPYLAFSSYRLSTKSRGAFTPSLTTVKKEVLGFVTVEDLKHIQTQLATVLGKPIEPTGVLDESLLQSIEQFQAQQGFAQTGLLDARVRQRLKELTESQDEDKIQRYSSCEHDRIKSRIGGISFLSEQYGPGAYTVSLKSAYQFSIIGCTIGASDPLICKVFIQVYYGQCVENHYFTTTLSAYESIALSNYLHVLATESGETPNRLSFIIYPEPATPVKWNLNLTE